MHIVEQMLNENRVCTAISNATGHLYLDDALHCHAFVATEDAIIPSIADTTLSEPRKYYTERFKADCYKNGACAIDLHFKEKIESYPLLIKHIPIGYYNQPLTSALMRYKQTQDFHALTSLNECKFLLATRITAKTRISYAIAKKDKDKVFYITHTDLGEFKRWVPEGREWHPLEIDYPTLLQIIRRDGLVINPASTRLLIERDCLPKPIRSKKK